MRRFEIQAEDPVDGERVTLCEGVQFSNGVLVIHGKFPYLGYTVVPEGVEALLMHFEPEDLVWIDKDMSAIAPPEPEEHGKHAVLEPEDAAAHAKLEHFFEPEPPQQL